MTKAQEMAVENLKNAFFKTFSYGHPEGREFKEVHIEYWEETETVYVRLEMGLIGDEGTMATIFCRDSTTTCIGKKGGYFQYRPTTNKECRLNLREAVYWGFHCRQLMEKKNKKKEA